MAETPDLGNKRLEDLEEEITCAVCHGHYQEAKLLPCMHYYCRMCIEELAKRSRGRPFPCPECRKDTNLPSGRAAKLQSAFFVERLKDLYCKMAKAEGKVEAVCEMCSGGKAVAFCRQCADFICAECVTHHQKLRVFSGHRVTTLEDLKRGGVKDLPMKEAPPPKCPEHDDQIMTIFCFDCNCLICRDCTVIDHNGHKFNFLKKCATESRKLLWNSLTPLQKVQANITAADKKLVATEAQVDAQEKEVCQAIQQSFGQLKALLEQRETELLHRTTTVAKEKKDALMAQRKAFQMAQTEIRSLMEFVRQNIENASDCDLIGIHTQLQAKVEEEEKRHMKLRLEPSTTANIVYISPPPNVIVSDLGEVLCQQFPAVLGEVPCTCELFKPMHVTVATPAALSMEISAELISLAAPASSVQVNVVQKGVRVYDITCTPCVRGRHDLTVKVNGSDISGSPFRVFVKIHPTQLGPLVRTITGFDRPWGIALNSNHQLVVAEWGGKRVTILETDGKKLQTIECDRFQGPCGVTTGPDGAFYVTDNNAKCLFKLDKAGRLLNTVQNKLKCPFFIKYIQNQLFVTDFDNHQVKIFNTDLNNIGTIPTTECQRPYDIAEAKNGLYVVGSDNIGVYTFNAKFAHYLNHKRSSTKLSYARGICFDSCGYLYVTQQGLGDPGVYVFKPSGEHVATFGQASSGVSMQWPAGIVIDEDGFVYVCDNTGGNCCVF